MGSEMFLINWFKGNLFQELMETIQSHFELWQAPPRLYLCEVKEDPVIFKTYLFELWQASPRLYLCEVKEDPVISKTYLYEIDKDWFNSQEYLHSGWPIMVCVNPSWFLP